MFARLLTVAVLCSSLLYSAAFVPSVARKTKFLEKTLLNENFNMDFSNPTIDSDPIIFTEKQLREYTATYSVDERFDIIKFFTGLFSKEDEESSVTGTPLAALEEKTAAFVTGKTDAKSFYATLKSAFGDKLPSVLPEIMATLPKDKAAALSSVK